MEIDNKLLLENSKHLSVLYVEDDISVRESTLDLLHNFFINIESAEDGLIGFEKYKNKLDTDNETFDLVITDLNMPNLNGIDMVKKMKTLQADQAIIFITAFNEVEFLNNAIEIGVNGFLIKPVETLNLKNTLYSVTQMISDRKLALKHYAQIEELNMLNIDKKDARGLTSAKDILKDLENAKEHISKLWTDKKVVQERLEGHLIDVEFFRTHYALKVIEYFLNVIRGNEEVGNCPVIFIMLDFFKNKDLPLKDIFMVCVLFKNTVSAYIFEKYSFNSVLFDDISVILDKNFEGVIINYLDIKYDKKVSLLETSTLEVKEVTQDEEKETEILEEVTDYAEYVLEHDVYELQDLEEDIDALAISITESSSAPVEDFLALGGRIKRYGEILNNYPIFSDLGACIVKLGVNFSLNAQLLYDDKERMMNIAALIEGFVNDLIVWRREIFDNNTDTPHFLDQSFFSNVDTIIMFIEYDESAVVEEEDFDDMFF